MRLAKFIEKLDNGEITDLKPYIEKEKLDILEVWKSTICYDEVKPK